jgi:leucyl-tRNA synthetase
VLAARRSPDILARLIAPFTPHLAEECWARSAARAWWSMRPGPVADAALAAEDSRTLPVQINGKRRAEIVVAAGLSEAEVEKIALADSTVAPHLAGLTVRKVIVVKDRIVNIVAA